VPPKTSSQIFLYLGFATGLVGGIWVTIVGSEVVLGWSQLTSRIAAFPTFNAGSSYSSLSNLASPNIFIFISRLALGILTIIFGIAAMIREKKASENAKGASFLILLGIYIFVVAVSLFVVAIYFGFGALSNAGGL